jgi:hypothetical protein
MWNDWLSSLNGPSGDQSVGRPDLPDPIETPRRFTNPAQIERLQSLQSQHQQLQVQQLHLLMKQHKLHRDLGILSDSTCAESTSSGTSTPIGGVSAALAEVVSMSKIKEDDEVDIDASNVKSEEGETVAPSDHGASDEQVSQDVWKQFHALQAQQWAQALNQARIAKRQTSASSSLSPTSLSAGIGSLMQSSNSLSGGKRCKAYAAPKGVWKNNGGYNATIYVHKRRIYGPIRRDLSDAIEDRKEMEDALRELTSIHSTPEDAAILEIEMREVVAGLRNRATPNRLPELGGTAVSQTSLPVPSSRALITDSVNSSSSSGRKRLRLVGTSEPLGSPDVLGPFASPLQVKPDVDDLDVSPRGIVADMMFEEPSFHMRGFTPGAGPVYGSPGPMFGSSSVPGLLGDDPVDMLPESSGLNSIWG